MSPGVRDKRVVGSHGFQPEGIAGPVSAIDVISHVGAGQVGEFFGRVPVELLGCVGAVHGSYPGVGETFFHDGGSLRARCSSHVWCRMWSQVGAGSVIFPSGAG